MFLTELVRHLGPLLEADAAQHRLRLRMDLTSTTLSVYANRVQIEQVILNLVRNGIEAIGDCERGGQLWIRTSRTGDDIGRGGCG